MLLNQYARIGRVFKKPSPIPITVSSSSFYVSRESNELNFDANSIDTHTGSLK